MFSLYRQQYRRFLRRIRQYVIVIVPYRAEKRKQKGTFDVTGKTLPLHDVRQRLAGRPGDSGGAHPPEGGLFPHGPDGRPLRPQPDPWDRLHQAAPQGDPDSPGPPPHGGAAGNHAGLAGPPARGTGLRPRGKHPPPPAGPGGNPGPGSPAHGRPEPGHPPSAWRSRSWRTWTASSS